MSKYWKDGKWIETDAQSVNLIPHDEETGDIDFNVKQYFQASPEEPTNPDIEVWLDTDEEALPNELTKNVSIEEIQGRTLVNLLGRSGNAIYKNWCYGTWGDLSYEHDVFKVDKTGTTHNRCNLHTLDYDIGITSGKYYIAIAEIKGDDAYITGATANQIIKYTNYGSGYNIYCVAFTPVDNKYIEVNSVSDIAYFKNLRLYEITSDEYYDINLLTAEEINMKYPYVDDIKCVVNPYLEYKENLLADIYLQRDVTYYLITDDIKLFGTIIESNATRACINSSIFVKKDMTYTLKNIDLIDFIPNLEIRLSLLNKSLLTYTDILPWGTLANKDFTFTIDSNKELELFFAFRKGEDLDFTENEFKLLENVKLCLTEGDTPKSYNECSNSRIMFETKLYDGETITRKNDGTYIKNSEWDEITLDKITFEFVNGATGYKLIRGILPNNAIGNKSQLIRYDGDIIKYEEIATITNEHWYIHDFTSNEIVLILPNILTGWGPNYTPTQEEIKAFFLGWKMSTKITNEIYNGTGDKQWTKLWCGIGEKHNEQNTQFLWDCIQNSVTFELPTVMNDQGYTPYRLIYKKENPTIEEVKTYGSLSIKNKNNIIASSGLVLNEKFKMFFSPYHTRGGKDTNNSKYYRIQKFLKAKDKNDNIIDFESVYGDNEYQIKFGKLSCNPIAVSDLQPYLYCDYMIYNPDTVKSFNYKINTSDDFTDYLNSLIKENNYLSQELSNTKQELNQIKYELSQRSNPNLLINGDFQIWQRGESFVEDKTLNVQPVVNYTADRWIDYDFMLNGSKIYKDTEGGITIDATEFRGIGDGVPLDQAIENVQLGKVTVTFSVYADNKIYKLTGKFSENKYIDCGRLCICMYQQKDFFEGKPFVQIYIKKGEKINIKWAKLELGEYATPFVPRSYGEELLACQRYYQGVDIEFYKGGCAAGERIGTFVSLPVSMRVTPTIISEEHSGVAIDLATKNPVATAYKAGVTVITNETSTSCRISSRLYLDAELY